ncbi:MAG: PilZ domain-containing protein [Rhabdaerophilum sp.]
MAERRIDPRMPCFLKGEIILNNGLERIPCEAHDISEKGLRLAGADFSRLPDSFLLSIPRRKFEERVKVVRKLDDGVGVLIV